MSKLWINVDDLLGAGDISKSHEETLRHAAEISPFVKERTIGPDKAEWQECSVGKNEEMLNGEQKEKDKSPQEVTKSVVISPILNKPSLQNLDFEMINAVIMMRGAEEKRKRLLHQKMLEAQEKYLAKMRHNVEKDRQLKEQQIKDIIAEKQRNESQLMQEAEKQTALQMKESERQLEEMHLQLKRQLHVKCFQGVAHYQSAFRIRYEVVAKLLMSIDKLALLPCSDYNHQLKELVEKFDQLIGKIKGGSCGPTELKLADELCVSLDTLQAAIHTDLEDFMKQQQKVIEEKQKEEQEAAASAAAAAATVSAVAAASSFAAVPTTTMPAPVTIAAQTPGSPSVGGINASPIVVSSAAQQIPTTAVNVVAPPMQISVEAGSCPAFYKEVYSFYQEKVESVKPLQSDENMKKYRFGCQKAINIPVNAISAVSPQHLQDKFEKIYSFLSGQTLRTPEGELSINDHPLGRSYCLLLTAKKFVNQGETAISSNPQAAFPVASVVVSLWKLVPDFGKLFLAYVFKESPFLVPKRGQSVEEYHDLKRQAGITRLYAAVMVTCGRQADGPAHPYGIDHAWCWLVDFTSLDPLPDISATLILELLQIVGANMWQAYGKQFTKLLLYIQKEYYPRLSMVDEGGPKARLEMLLVSYLNQKQIPKPQGMLPPMFW